MIDFNTPQVASSLLSKDTLEVIAAASLGGLVGGFGNHLRTPNEQSPKLHVSLILGVLASLVALYVLEPSSGVKLVALSIAAGYGGKATLDAMQARVQAQIAQQQAQQARQDAAQATQKAEDSTRKLVQAIGMGRKALDHAKNIHGAYAELKKAFTPPDPSAALSAQGPAGALPGLQQDLPGELSKLGQELDSLEGKSGP
jgi:hypothetical protein